MKIFRSKQAKQKEAMSQARADYDKAVDPGLSGGNQRRLQARIANRCRAHLDKTFIEGAERTATYEDAVMAALAAGQEKPLPPKARLFQIVPAFDHEVVAYLPEHYAERIFDLGRRYQRMDIDGARAVQLAQGIAEEICFELNASQTFVALQFLRDQLAQEGIDLDEEEPRADSGSADPA